MSESSIVPSLLFEHKSYCLFCALDKVLECMQLCRTYIRQGNTVCLVNNCPKNHRNSKQLSMVPRQLFMLKKKDVVFIEPALDEVLLTK